MTEVEEHCEAQQRLTDTSDTVLTDSDATSTPKSKYELTEELKDKIKHLPEVLEFIILLQKYIEKQRKKLHKIRSKFKKQKPTKEACTQTDVNNDQNVPGAQVANGKSEEKAEDPKSLADEIKEAAEQAVQNSGFVYEETSGLYYDYNTGYYYNAEYGLYYDGNTGTYMKYNQETQEYEFHSQVSLSSQQEYQQASATLDDVKEKHRAKRKKKLAESSKANKRSCLDADTDAPETNEDLEEGECSFSSSDETSDVEDEDNSDSSDISKQWPPCMRIIVEETSVPNLKKGSLHIVTYEGGSLGREGDHCINISDVNVSKHHLKFSFDKETSKYLVTDLGSRNGTLLNGKRISPSKQESEPLEIAHGSKIQIGSTILLCHIHDGNHTCGHCEPGLIQSTMVTTSDDSTTKKICKISRNEKHKNELKNLRKKFGVANFEEDPSKLATGYTDRAQKRRDTVGSQNPHEKTQSTSLDEAISKENKGFKLLSKMGWKEGQSLGKEGLGIKEPVALVSNPGNAGIGCTTPATNNTLVDANKQNIWQKTQERFEKLPEKNDAFEDCD